jgi:hypothetical protein
MESFFEGVSGGNKGKFTLAATVDEHSLVFALVRSEDEKPAVIPAHIPEHFF